VESLVWLNRRCHAVDANIFHQYRAMLAESAGKLDQLMEEYECNTEGAPTTNQNRLLCAIQTSVHLGGQLKAATTQIALSHMARWLTQQRADLDYQMGMLHVNTTPEPRDGKLELVLPQVCEINLDCFDARSQQTLMI
jgi:hypothetical protein